MPRITWLELNASYAHSSLALPLLHAQSSENVSLDTFEWTKVSGTLKSRLPAMLGELIDLNPDIVFATVWSFTHDFLLQILARLKALRPNIVVVLGGPEFLGENHDFLSKNKFVDAVFRGEGDLFLLQWGPIWNNPSAWIDLPGLCFFSSNDTYIDGGLNRIERFDRLVPPEKSPFFPVDKAFVQMETTRGCFNTCSFCVSGGDSPVRHLALEQIALKLDYYVSKGIRQVRVLDRTFNASPQYANELLHLFCKYEGKLSFHLEIHPSILSESLRSLLCNIPFGLLHLEAGLQSLSDEVLKISGRVGDTDRALEGLQFLFSLENMETHTDLIAGLPYYSYYQTINDVRQLVKMRAGEIQLESLKLLPGTELRRVSDSLGIRYSPFPPYEVLETPSLSFESLQSLLTLSRLLDIYYNHSIWQPIFIHLSNRSSDLLQHFIHFFQKQGFDDQLLSQEKQGSVLGIFLNDYDLELMPTLQEVWIRSGLPLGKLPGLIETITIKGEALESYGFTLSCYARGYGVETDRKRWVVIYDRAIDQSQPIHVVEIL